MNLYFIHLPFADSRSWASWLRWLNPIAYAFENIMVNEFDGRSFECASFVPSGPGYEGISADQQACAVQGSLPGSSIVSGTAYVETAFSYRYGDRWSNYGIILAITVILFVAHLVMSELVASERSKGEVLVFRRSKMKPSTKQCAGDEETKVKTAHKREQIIENRNKKHEVQQQISIFHWEKVNYEIQIQDETRTILDSVDGWIKPGTLTALMVSMFVQMSRPNTSQSAPLPAQNVRLCLNRVFQVQVRRPCLTSSLVGRQWV